MSKQLVQATIIAGRPNLTISERAGGIRAIITLVDRVRILHPEVPSVMAALSLGGATVEAVNAVEGAA